MASCRWRSRSISTCRRIRSGRLSCFVAYDAGAGHEGSAEEHEQTLLEMHGGALPAENFFRRQARKIARGEREARDFTKHLPVLPSARQARNVRVTVFAFSLTIFTSAWLLFLVQPLIARFILPWFGGSPAVWTTCMLFFQTLLPGGYAYAHLITASWRRVNRCCCTWPCWR